jgi:hypothetical protein
MKRMVFTETRVDGPARFNAVLPHAPANLGFYADSVVLALGESDVANLRSHGNLLQPQPDRFQSIVRWQ